MKTLKEIKDEIAKEHMQENWSNLMHKYGGVGDTIIDEVSKRYAEECVKASLEKAGDMVEESEVYEGKESIINPENIILL